MVKVEDLLQPSGSIELGKGERIIFFHPVEIGSYSVCCWCKEQTKERCGCSIYENGRIVHLQSEKRFCEWSKKALEGTLAKGDLHSLLKTIAETFK
jgi:hypothetical protein